MRRLHRASLFVALFAGTWICAGGGAPSARARGGKGAPVRCLQFAISPDGGCAWIPAADRHTLLKVSLADGAVLAEQRYSSPICAVDLSPDGSSLAVAFAGGDRIVLTGSDLSLPGTEVPTGRQPLQLEFGFDGSDLCVLCPKDEEVDVIDVRRQRLVGILPTATPPTSMSHFEDRVALTLPASGELAIYSTDHQPLATVRLSPVPDWVVAGGFEVHAGGGHAPPTEGGRTGTTTSTYDNRMPSRPPPQATTEPGESTGVLVVVSRSSDTVSIVDARSYDVLAMCRVDAPLVAAAGDADCRWAFVLHSNGLKVSVVSIDPAQPGFGKVAWTVDLRRPCTALEVSRQGICWALGLGRPYLMAIDPARPSDSPARIVTVGRSKGGDGRKPHAKPHAKNDPIEEEYYGH